MIKDLKYNELVQKQLSYKYNIFKTQNKWLTYKISKLINI